jgi:hypothetical protein
MLCPCADDGLSELKETVRQQGELLMTQGASLETQGQELEMLKGQVAAMTPDMEYLRWSRTMVTLGDLVRWILHTPGAYVVDQLRTLPPGAPLVCDLLIHFGYSDEVRLR